MESSVATDEPRWVRDLALLWLHEVRLFAVTALRFTVNPRRFGAAWASGEMRAMNPLAFLAASWPILLPIDYGLQALADGTDRPNLPLVPELLRSLKPYLYVIPLALILFAVFRLAGSRRRLSTTMGVLLYWTAFSIVGWIVGVVGNLLFHVGHWLPHLTGYLTMIWGALALAGAHDIHWGWSLLAFAPTCVFSIRGVGWLLEWLGWGNA